MGAYVDADRKEPGKEEAREGKVGEDSASAGEKKEGQRNRVMTVHKGKCPQRRA